MAPTKKETDLSVIQNTSIKQKLPKLTKDEKTLIVSPLPLTAVGVTFPITVEHGTNEAIEILIDYGNKLATKSEGDKLCSFGQVRFRGSISDSLQGTSEPVPPNLVDVTGCL